MNISREEKKYEAIQRMKMLGIFNETIRQFEIDDLVSISMPPYGAFYWVDDTLKEMIQQFEVKHNALVYMIIRSYTSIGTMDSFLFISDYKEEWRLEHADMQMGILFAYVYNYLEPLFSEFGSIEFRKSIAGGLIRIS